MTKLFMHLMSHTAPDSLAGRIMREIAAARTRAAKRRMLAYGVTSLASVGVAVWSFVAAAITLMQSGFLSYASLIFSDTGLVIGAARPFALSLVESLPLLPISIFFAAAFILLVSLRSWARADDMRLGIA